MNPPLHPGEWNIGEAAGALAAFALQRGVAPATVRAEMLAPFQQSLLAEGVPLAWIVDVAVDHPAFKAVQTLFMTRRLAIGLAFEPDAPLRDDDWRAWGGSEAPPTTRATGALRLEAGLAASRT